MASKELFLSSAFDCCAQGCLWVQTPSQGVPHCLALAAISSDMLHNKGSKQQALVPTCEHACEFMHECVHVFIRGDRAESMVAVVWLA